MAANLSPDSQREAILQMDANLSVKIGKGLSDIKQCELYFKWREFLPDEFKDITCPRPSDEVLTRHFKKSTDKRKEKQEEKRMQKREVQKLRMKMKLKEFACNLMKKMTMIVWMVCSLT